MDVRTYGDKLSPLLVAARHSMKNSIVGMMSYKDKILPSAVSVDGQNAIHLVVQNQQCSTSLDVSIHCVVGYSILLPLHDPLPLLIVWGITPPKVSLPSELKFNRSAKIAL